MAQENDQGEKTEEPSQKRIDESRQKGEVAISKELNSVLILTASVVTLALSIVFIYEQLSEFAEWIFRLDLENAYGGKVSQNIMSKAVWTAAKCTAPIFSVVFAVGVISSVLQTGFLYAPEVLTLKFDRINPVNGTKKLFSMRSVVEAAKGFLKFTFILSIVYIFFQLEFESFRGFLHTEFLHAFLYGKWVLTKLALSIIGGLLVIAVADFAYQRYSHWQKLKMTKQEAKQENKEQDGNPEIKQKIKSIQKEMSQKRMMSEIPEADVVVTNPTHISIVIKYDGEKMVSPTVVGKGADHLALKIRELAKEHDVPIVENVPLARSLYKSVDDGGQVPRSLYKAVAEVLAFVYKLKRKKSALSSAQQAEV